MTRTLLALSVLKKILSLFRRVVTVSSKR